MDQNESNADMISNFKHSSSRKRRYDEEISHPIVPTTLLTGNKKAKKERKQKQSLSPQVHNSEVVERMTTRLQSRRASAINTTKEIVSTKISGKVGESSKVLADPESKVSLKCRNAFMDFIKKILLQRETNIPHDSDTVKTTNEITVQDPPVDQSHVSSNSQNVATPPPLAPVIIQSIDQSTVPPSSTQTISRSPDEQTPVLDDVQRTIDMEFYCHGDFHRNCKRMTYDELYSNFYNSGIGERVVESVIQLVLAYIINECASEPDRVDALQAVIDAGNERIRGLSDR